MEILVDYAEGNFREILREADRAVTDPYFDGLSPSPVEGQEAEINSMAVAWVAASARKIKKGFLLTIDYGGSSEELISVRKKKGTLLCYRNHQTAADPYQWIGEQDMTTHVNFSVLQAAGMKSELLPLGYTDQTNFLIGLGIVGEMERYLQRVADPTKDPAFRAMSHLIHPEGLGPVFKVLIQQKNIGACRLKGLAYGRPAV